MQSSPSWLKDICVLTLLLGALYSLFLGTRPLTPPDEARYSEIPREMVASGNYITPTLNGVKYFEKPALFYWLQSISIKTFGLHEWSLRLVTQLMGILGCLLTYWGTRHLYDRKTGLIATAILASSALYAALAHFITLDMTVSVFLTGCFLSFLLADFTPNSKSRRNYLWTMYVFAALATMTKGLIGIILPGMVIAFWLIITQQWRQLTRYYLLSGTLIFLAITLPWHILVQLKNPEFFNFYFIQQHFLRYFTNYADRQQPFWFFPLTLALGFFPWTGFLLGALLQKRGTETTQETADKKFKLLPRFNYFMLKLRTRNKEVFLFLWAALIFIFYWFSHSQLTPYMLPVFTPLAILTGIYINKNWHNPKALQIGFITACLFSIVICIGVMCFIHHNKLFSLSNYDSIIFIPLLFMLSYYLFYKIDTRTGFVLLLISTFALMYFANTSYELFDQRSVKPLAIKLGHFAKKEDIVYNFNHYYQDLPVYLGRNVRVINWTGELTFGSQHQATQNIFLNETQLLAEWPNHIRKFMLLKKEDLPYLKNHLKLNYFLIEQQGRHALISNQEVK